MNTIKVNIRRFIFILCFFSICVDASPVQEKIVSKKLISLQRVNKVHIGVSAWNMQNNKKINYHAHERFPMDSTSKLMTAASILFKAQRSPGFLKNKIAISHQAVQRSGYAPITRQYIGNNMSVADLCRAAIEESDNTAANLLMSHMGGPMGITKFARSIGDKKFYLARWEPNLNTAIPEDKRDTTTPYAMAHSLKKIVFGNLLSQSMKNKLIRWMKHCKTGKHRIRAAVPQGWVVGDKTGTGDYGSIGDVAIIWPPRSSPLIVAIYVSKNIKNAKTSDQVIASTAKIVIPALLGSTKN